MEWLWLHDNIIHNVQPGGFGHLIRLKELKLNGNKLKGINADGFENIGASHYLNIIKLWLSGNPIQCDCDIAWLHKADGKWVAMSDKSSLTCDGPARYSGQNWTAMHDLYHSCVVRGEYREFYIWQC